MSWVQLGWSIAALLALAGVARLLRLGESRIGSPSDACRIAEELLAGFQARRGLVGRDGRAALVAGNGTVAVLRRTGMQVAARRLIPPLRLREAVEGVTIDTGERLFGPVLLFGVLADDVHALAPVLIAG